MKKTACGSSPEALAKIGGDQAVAALLDALKSEKTEIRACAAKALGKIGDLLAFMPLLSQLKEKEPGSRESAARALQALVRSGDPRTVAPLLAVLNGNDGNARRSAAEILGAIDHKVLARGLKKSLSRKRSLVRRKAAEVVGYYASEKQVLDTLQDIADDDPVEEVRTAAREAAEEYANKLR